MAKKTSASIAKEALKGPVVEEIPKDLSDAKPTEADNPEHHQPHLTTLQQRKDPTYFPGCNLQWKNSLVFDHKMGIERPLGKPAEYVYQFWPFDAVGMAVTEGWQFCGYDGGSRSGLADKGFKDTHLYQNEAGTGRVVLGDTYLMYVPIRLAEELKEEVQKLNDAMEAKPNTSFFDDAYKTGIRGFTENEYGDKEYN